MQRPGVLHGVVILCLISLFGLSGPAAAPAAAAGPFTVNTTIDVTDAVPGNGVCEVSAGSGLCTLRAAVMEANALAGRDTIILPSGTYTLTLPGNDNTAQAGDLDINESLNLQGAGQATTIIAASSAISDRVFSFYGGPIWMSGVTVRGGNVDTNSGGGIYAGTSFTLTASTVRDNHSGYGGAIYNGSASARVVLIDSRLISNTTQFGGGLMLYGGQAWLTRTVVSGNTTTQFGGGVYVFSGAEVWLDSAEIVTNTSQYGGGVAVAEGQATLVRSAVRGNSASQSGGGLYNADHVIVINSTINLNEAGRWGGGLYNITASVASLYNATVAANSADADANNVGQGGGLAVAGGTVVVRDTLVANNGNVQLLTSPVPDDCWGALTSSGYNLIEATNGCLVLDNLTGNVLGQDPHIGTLRSDGGAPAAYTLLPNSPALDAGNPFNGCYDNNGRLVTDQRGQPRHADGDGDGVAVCDIGAFEVQQLLYLPLTRR